ncbi:hypothetical protein QTP86_010648, partial [Hemibagrus guttatus]
TTASARISACLVDISSWMTAHQLKINPRKTELLVTPGDSPPAQDLAISLNNSMISPSATARNLGVTMDNQLSFSSHVTNVTRSCRFLLYNIRRIRPFLSTRATQAYEAGIHFDLRLANSAPSDDGFASPAELEEEERGDCVQV